MVEGEVGGEKGGEDENEDEVANEIHYLTDDNEGTPGKSAEEYGDCFWGARILSCVQCADATFFSPIIANS